MESSTEILRKLLDERGDDYTRNDFGITWSYYSDPHTATESMDGTLIVTGLTPEQAIAATLGSGECEDVGQAAVFKCSECGWYSPVFTFGHDMPQFCPSCGRRVKGGSE